MKNYQNVYLIKMIIKSVERAPEGAFLLPKIRGLHV